MNGHVVKFVGGPRHGQVASVPELSPELRFPAFDKPVYFIDGPVDIDASFKTVAYERTSIRHDGVWHYRYRG